MKFKSITLIIASALSVVGCGGGSQTTVKPTVDPDIANSLKAETKVDFDLLSANKKIVIPSYLGMDVQDGTLATREGATAPEIAMGQTDGWSTTQPITINFKGKALDPTTAANSFYLIKSGDPTNPDDTTEPTLLSQQNGDFMVTVSGNSLIVMLFKPLEPSSNYMFAVTDDLKDMNGETVGMSNSYALLKADSTPPTAALIPAQKITHATEEAFHNIVAKRDIIFSSWFTTLSVGDVLYAAKMATLQTISKQIETDEPVIASDNIANEENLYKLTRPQLGGVYGTTTPAGNEIYTGTVFLPYYLSTDSSKISSSPNAPEKYLVSPWKSDMPSLAKIKYVLTNGSDADKRAIASQLSDLHISDIDLARVATDKATQIKVLTALKGQKLTLANGKQLDPERLITRYSPVPQLQSVAAVQYNLIMPKLDKENQEKCKQSGYSVTIFQHGVTSNKEQFVYSNPSLPDKIIGNQCRAIFAIDLPLHGTRGIGGKNASEDPKMFLNFIDLAVARDNLRQSVIDVVNLRAIIGKVLTDSDPSELGEQLSALSLNNNNVVSFAGHSLGAITGVDVADIANRTIFNDQYNKTLFNIDTVALANPGAEIPYLLLNSPSFSDLIKGGIVDATSPSFSKQCGNTNLALCYKHYVAQLNASKDSGNSLAQITLDTLNDNFNKFAYAAQTVMDPADPINHASFIPKTTAVLLEEMKNDMVIPNKSAQGTNKIYSPFTGTSPLLKPLQLSQTIKSVTESPLKTAVRFEGGYHSSVLTPLNPLKLSLPATEKSIAVTNEMQSVIASFINSNGTSLTINDDSVITSFND
ncbi:MULTISPECIES: VolA/Pla-1 family phospholipase [unclassified Photobacterium]|uniref:VolA/Pla-1 family phospholipase n=1 Tax=unclassified Photobacterium TaxID=2628852 RepID=UPI001EDD9765|nr:MULTISPECIES: VolA/Pla-1 family phospholipase [unclassified Photobacterium]MCG3863281.1 Ig-like domain-containing protein [Photobacterium sp. Ph6]MCG3874811.1 Ig-like domain-containing protein [Photobacterium sp. Ph5]